MADFPERTVTAQTNMAEYERAMRIEKLRKKFGNNLWNVSALRGRGWANTSAAKQWKSAINSGGSSLTGLSTRLKMMADADKELIGNTFTGNFQDFLTKNPDATIGLFNEWANEQGPWYEAERRARDQKVVKDRLEAMKSTKVAEAVDTLFGEYNDEWITGGYAEQNQVREDVANSDAIKNLPSKWRQLAIDEVIKSLNALLTPTGQYAAAAEARRVTGEERAVTAEEAAERERMQKTMDISSDDLASRIAMKAYDYMQDDNMEREAALEKAIDDDRALAAGDTVAPYARKGYVAARAKLEKLIKEPAKLQTQTYYDPDLQDYVLATAEQAETEGLLPEKVGARLQPQLMSRHNAEDRFWLDAGDELQREGVLTKAIYNFYRKHARLVDDPREQDSEIIRIWKARKKKLEAEAKAVSPSIIFQTATGASGGQTDDGIKSVVVSPTKK